MLEFWKYRNEMIVFWEYERLFSQLLTYEDSSEN